MMVDYVLKGAVIVLLVASALAKPCPVFESYDAADLRLVTVTLTTEGCGSPVTGAAFTQKCGKSPIGTLQENSPGVYSYLGPKDKHFIKITKDGHKKIENIKVDASNSDTALAETMKCLDADWTVVFRGTPGIGDTAYEAWIDGTNTVVNTACMDIYDTTCNNHYRDPSVDNWATLGASRVRYSMHKDGAQQAYVVFNSAMSDKEDWFAKSRILDSSWTSLATSTTNFFSLIGATSRTFYINKAWGGCSNDPGYTVVIDHASSTHFCSYDTSPTVFPQFLYADSTSYLLTQNYEVADAMAIETSFCSCDPSA